LPLTTHCSTKQVPTTDELETWLASDNTSAITYSVQNFVCGDFAVMLSQHAKLKHWDMGIVAINGYDSVSNEPFAHALNFIYTQEGLVYVEPQNDNVWWYGDAHQMITEGATWRIDYLLIAVASIDIVVWG
jgi:hypothetical protein